MTPYQIEQALQSLKCKLNCLIENSISTAGSPVDVNLIWVGSQAEYDAIETKDENTLYFIL